MINQPILMDAELGRLVIGLRPETVKQVFTINDEKYFHQILSILGVEGRVAKERWDNISFEIEASYSFRGVSNLKSGYVAVFDSRIRVCPTEKGSDSGWSVERFALYDRFYSVLNKMLKISPSVEMDIPDIEEVILFLIDVTAETLSRKVKFWRIRR